MTMDSDGDFRANSGMARQIRPAGRNKGRA
jgi:hypothetical protein